MPTADKVQRSSVGCKLQLGETIHPVGPAVARRAGARTLREPGLPAPRKGVIAPDARPKGEWRSSSSQGLLASLVRAFATPAQALHIEKSEAAGDCELEGVDPLY